jgi:hypothetical protein
MPDSRGDSRPRLFGGAKLRRGDVQLNDVVHVRFLRCETTGELRSPDSRGRLSPRELFRSYGRRGVIRQLVFIGIGALYFQFIEEDGRIYNAVRDVQRVVLDVHVIPNRN